MVSKDEPQRKLEVAEIANERLTRELDRLKDENEAHERREAHRAAARVAKADAAREKAKRDAIEKRLVDRGRGIFDLGDAVSSAIVREDGKVTLEVAFELTPQETRAVQRRLEGDVDPGKIRINVLNPWHGNPTAIDIDRAVQRLMGHR